ncbi:MAG TPA: alpha-hydroxy acid oxidase [Candidatus Acidoferrales bacterium]
MSKRSTRKKTPARLRPASSAAVAGDVPQRRNFVPACLADFELLAKQCFSRPAWEYIHSGAADENTARWNVESLTHLRLKPRVMVNVSKIDTSTRLLGHDLPHPILVAPTSSHLLVHPEAEIATARGAGAADAILIASTLSNFSIDEIIAAATGPVWFQLYADDDRGKTKALIEHAQAAGCQALCITVDLPWIYARNREAHILHEVPQLPYPNIKFTGGPASTGLKTWGYRNVSWADLEWIRGFCKLPLLLKGVLNPEDAELAVQHGAAGIVVSNHGGRGLDTVPASIDALPAVAEKIAGRIPVLMDGGIRRGTDVLKAIARGASAVLLGRPILYGLGVAGSEGVQNVIEILRTEFEAAMALAGRTSISAIDSSVLW